MSEIFKNANNTSATGRDFDVIIIGAGSVSYTHLTLPTIYSV